MICNFKRGRILFQTFLIYFVSSGIWTSCLAQGTVYVSGKITGKTTWSADTIKVTGSVSVDTLVIEPGTVVEFQEYYHLAVKKLTADGEMGDTILFTINDTAGFSDPDAGTGGWGGIIGYKILLKYCKVQYVKISKTAHRAGAVVSLGGSLDIQNSSITNNNTNGIYKEGPFNIRNSLIANNAGQGIEVEHCVLKVDDCIIRNNLKEGIFTRYGSVYIENSTIESNGNYGISSVEPSSFSTKSNIIQNNRGTGIWLNSLESSLAGIFSNNIIRFNNGYGLSVSVSRVAVINNLITGNSKTGANLGLGRAGPSTLVNNTIINNSNGIAICQNSINMYNCICRDNDKREGEQNINLLTDGHCKIYNSNIEGLNTDDLGGEFVNNIDTDPRFVDTTNFDFHLSDSSPCINAGTIDTTGLFLPQTDIDGKPRITNGWIDMGAFESLELPGNQPPIIEMIQDQLITPGTTKSFNVRYLDPDPGDQSFVLRVSSDIPEIQVQDIVDNLASVNFVIVTDPDWQGNGEVQIQVIDNNGNIGVRKVHFIISKEVCGIIQENTLWVTDTIKVTCDVIVSSKVILTIKPGTIVEFDNGCHLIVFGSIIAIGNKDSLITFTSSDTTGFYNQTYIGWKGIRLAYDANGEFRYGGFLYAIGEVDGGALSFEGGHKYPLKITNCKFYNNYSQRNGGAFSGDVAEFKNNVFFNNRAKYLGGAIYFWAKNIDIINNLFFSNKAESGAAIHAGSGTIRLINNTIVGNKAEISGGGAYIGHGNILNCIIWDNESGILNDQVTIQDSGTVGDCIIEGGVAGINYTGPAPVIKGPVFSENPAFVNETLFDFHLTDTSDGINSGTMDTTGLNLPESDLDGNPRVFDGRIDMGAFEYQHDNFHILKQPVSQVICAGAAVTLETEAIGGVVGFQWQKNGADIPSANHGTLTFNPVSINDSGYYHCLIIADDKIVSTDTIILSIDTGINIESQSDSFSICPGKDSLIYVTVSGGNGRNYSWSKNDSILPGVTEPELIITSPAIQQLDIYFCTISNACGSVVSEKIKVTASIIPDPPVSSDVTVCEGQSVPDLAASGDHITWYSDAELTNPVHSGSNFNTGQSNHGFYVYYATQMVSGCESTTGMIKLTINRLPVISLGTDSTISTNQNFILGPYTDSYSYLWNNNSESPSFEISGNDFGTGSHTIWVVVTDTNTCQNSDTMIVIVVPLTNIKQTQNNNRLYIFPNPTDGLLNIKLSDFHDEDIIVKLFNQQSEEILSDKICVENKGGTIQLNIISYPAGIYYIQIITNNGQYVGKVVLQ